MERKENSGSNFDGGFNTLICEEDLNNEPPFPITNQDRKQVFAFNMALRGHNRLATVSLVLLAVVLLIVDISLGVHYNNLKDTHLTLEDTQQIGNELNKLQDTYKTAIDTMKGYKKKLGSEMSHQTQTNWELEHQTKRASDYETEIDKLTKDIQALRSHVPMINDGCKHCPPGWILRDSVCYYFPFLKSAGLKSWQKSREFCQMHGGDLAIIDTKDKENFTVNHLISNRDYSDPSSYNMGFWIGLQDVQEEGIWKWFDGKLLVEAYWNDGEPNDINTEDCAAVYPRENFFKAWNDVMCGATMKWICEKAITKS